ncbi:hypothetical protein [Nocardia nepalensis]|uniref:hypothetical protein n=1 Tax=Nocardia nepalensis TaxID=3375448 RepID=UPI003B67D9B6
MIFINLGDPGHSHLSHRLSGVGLMLSVVFFCTGMIGACTVWIRRRTRRILRRYPWLEYQIGYLTNHRYEWVELRDINGNRISQLIVSSWVHQIGAVVDGSSSTAWFAGDPRKRGVISAPGGGVFRYAYYSPARQPPEFSFRENRSGTRLDPAGAPPQSVREFQLTPDRGRVVVKPVDESVGVIRHGSSEDTRYPSPRILRRVFAFVIDWSLHIGGAAALVLLGKGSVPLVGGVALGVWLATSFADRVILQGAFHTTVGKALFGLCVIQSDDGSFPSYGRLTKVWFMNLYFSAMLPLALFGGDGPGPENLSDYFLPAVRRRDIPAHS